MRNAVVAAIFLVLCANGSVQAADLCPPMPDAIGASGRDVKSEISISVGKLGPITAGEIDVKTDVVAKEVFAKFPNLDKLILIQTLSSTYCQVIASKPDRDVLWDNFSRSLLGLQPSSPVTAPKGGPALLANTKGTLHRVQGTHECPTTPWVPVMTDNSVRIGLGGTTIGQSPRVAAVFVQKRLGSGDIFVNSQMVEAPAGSVAFITLPDDTKLAIQLSDVYECQANYVLSKQ